MSRFGAFLSSLGVLLISACATSDRPPVPLAKLELPRMYGGWYIVATIPNFLEHGAVGGYDVYSKGAKPDLICEEFHMQRGGFDKEKKHYVVDIAVRPDTNNADWRIQPIWPLWLPFQIHYVDPDYRFALFGEENRESGWVHSRTREISDQDYDALMARFKDLGYDTTKFLKVVQTPDQIGKPGF
jgi:apolipoprotein D and lipocalin family protein